MKQIERVQTGLRLEKRLLKVLKGLAEHLEIPVAELIEGMALHAFEGKAPLLARNARQDRRAEGGLRAGPDRRRRPSPERRRRAMKVVPPKRVSRTYTQSLVGAAGGGLPAALPGARGRLDRGLGSAAGGEQVRRCRGRLRLRHALGAGERRLVCHRLRAGEGLHRLRPLHAGGDCDAPVDPGRQGRRRAPARASPSPTPASATKGDAFVDAFTEAAYADFMQLWERRMNHYLTTGTCLAA